MNQRIFLADINYLVRYPCLNITARPHFHILPHLKAAVFYIKKNLLRNNSTTKYFNTPSFGNTLVRPAFASLTTLNRENYYYRERN
ncbi:unnamed protein product [Schistosoma mattheei]|uniref:Uncharacterized protein n=1 Tax=Schistosoma mattheei TaxID=31246 RepID=A0A183P833_9TREM|nr:unnamed protein product [Schistosoma mattheei]